MIKKPLTLLVSAALISGVSAVQAGDITTYGKLHLSLDQLDDGSNADSSSLYVSSNSSRLGFKGGEKLGEGMELVWQLEGSVTLDSGGGNLFNRNSYLGVKTANGTVLMGIHDTPFKTLGRKVDFFGDQVGDARNLTRLNSAGTTGFDERPGNVLAYVSPNWSGISVRAALIQEDGVKDRDALSISGMYKAGPIMAGLAIENHGAAFNAGTEGSSATRLVGSYKLDAVKINALYQTATDVTGVSGNDISTIGVGAAFKTGMSTIKAQYYMLSGEGTGTDASMMAIGYDYKLSKMTKVYAAYAATSNDANVNYEAADGGHGDDPAIANDDDPTSLSFGIVHKF